MPRKTRKRLIGRTEDIERQWREHGYAELEDELHISWSEPPGQVTAEFSTSLEKPISDQSE